MKPQELRQEFIRLRAEGTSYGKIADALHISKSTCTAWERELKADITRLQQEKLNELYSSYGMVKEARIRRLGDTLRRIDDALTAVDLTAIAPEKLLDFKLKYSQALREEFTGTTAPPAFEEGGTPEELQAAFTDIYNRVRQGDITAEQAGQELRALAAMLTAYQTTEAKDRIEAIDAIISGRKAV